MEWSDNLIPSAFPVHHASIFIGVVREGLRGERLRYVVRSLPLPLGLYPLLLRNHITLQPAGQRVLPGRDADRRLDAAQYVAQRPPQSRIVVPDVPSCKGKFHGILGT